MVKQSKFSYKNPGESECVKARASNVKVSFKNLLETGNAVRGMSVKRAQGYLKNVIARTECVPFRKFKGGIGKCAQAKQFKTTIGRWPINAAKCLRDLLNNAISNAEFYEKEPQDMYIAHIQVNSGPVSVRKTFRAHGRINPYERHLSHVELILRMQENKN